MSMAMVCTMAAAVEASPWFVVQLGQQGDVPVVRDYDDNKVSDYATWRPSDGTWHLKTSPGGPELTQQWGQLGDVPVPADFTGDKQIDWVVWRPSEGNWYIRDRVTGQHLPVRQWGQAGDVPLPGDYTGDGRTDFAVYRPGNGYWYVIDGVTGAFSSGQWGQVGDVPVAGDFDGRPGFDYTVFRPSTGEWLTYGPLVRRQQATYRWGQTGDVPLTANATCSTKAGQMIYRPSTGHWWSNGVPVQGWGYSTDLPTPGNFTGDRAADYTIWRPSEGKFYVLENDVRAVCNAKWDAATALVDATKEQVHGVTVAAVKHGEIVWSYGAGMANSWDPATPDIPWQVASLSKLVLGTAVLRASDQGQLQLDGPGGLTNPYTFQNASLRMHANHTATLRADLCTVINGLDAPSNLAAVLQPCLFSPNVFFHYQNRPMGLIYEYSNLGAAWPARRLEMATGRDFAQFTHDEIFNKLGMTSTGWFASVFAGRSIANAYSAPNHPSSLAFGMSPYPSGNLRTTAHDFARFMIMWTSGGIGNGTRILQTSTVNMALSPSGPPQVSPLPTAGFYWHQAGSRWMHRGEFTGGICTQVSIDPLAHTGVVVFTNGRCLEAETRINEIQTAAYEALSIQ